MTLVGIRGNHHAVNRELLLHAFDNTPALILDCANCANPHSLFPEVEFEKFDSVYVIEIELLYKLRDTLKRVPAMAKSLGLKSIVITSGHHLFDYSNDEENNNIYEHSWELMKEISDNLDIMVAVDDIHSDFAHRFCTKVI
ncbi:MAG: hypothetical protein ABH879_10505 [archaeon]